MELFIFLAIVFSGCTICYRLTLKAMKKIHYHQGLTKSLPSDFASFGLFCGVFGGIVGLIFAYYYQDYSILTMTLSMVITIAGCYSVFRITIHKDMNIRFVNEKIYTLILMALSFISVIVTASIVMTLLLESLRFFQSINFLDFIFGTHWNPQVAFHNDQEQNNGSFGALALFAGTLLISFIAIAIALPVGLISAIYLSEYAHVKTRNILKPLLEILAGIPTVVYGFFAALALAPQLRILGQMANIDIASESALAAGLVMGIMIIPLISSLTEDVLNSIPQAQREASYALGATQSETIKKILLPASLQGIFATVLLALSRAIGETMIVVMAAGLVAKLTLNPLDAVTTVTVQIVTLLIGDAEFDNPRTLAAFALGLMLFVVTLLLNIASLYVLKHKEKSFGKL